MELYHHGIKGMKWGVRRFQDKNGDLTPAGKKRYASDKINSAIKRENATQKKFAKIAEGGYANAHTRRIAKARSQSVGTRLAKDARTVAAKTALSAFITASRGKFSGMSKAEIAADVAKYAAKNAAVLLAKEVNTNYQASRIDRRYNADGTTKDGKKEGLLSREQKIDAGVAAGLAAASALAGIGGAKLLNVKVQRAVGEARMKSWGDRILSERVDNVIWQSPDLSSAIIDNRNR